MDDTPAHWGCGGRDRMVVGLKLPMQSVPITTNVVSSNLDQGEVYNVMSPLHSTYTEKLQINGQTKLYTIYTNTVNRQMELAGRTNYHIYISNKFT